MYDRESNKYFWLLEMFDYFRLQLQGEVAAGDVKLAYRGMFKTALGIAKEEVKNVVVYLF